ncbi:putative membrane protein [Prochlorococcus sp. MIT 0602]|nr:putative membrane protein [Prochlorococcus sp. MIT 0602]KGG17577.1 putative membrane protein [Prochlorococcus sp. MIT 0603]
MKHDTLGPITNRIYNRKKYLITILLIIFSSFIGKLLQQTNISASHLWNNGNNYKDIYNISIYIIASIPILLGHKWYKSLERLHRIQRRKKIVQNSDYLNRKTYLIIILILFIALYILINIQFNILITFTFKESPNIFTILLDSFLPTVKSYIYNIIFFSLIIFSLIKKSGYYFYLLNACIAFINLANSITKINANDAIIVDVNDSKYFDSDITIPIFFFIIFLLVTLLSGIFGYVTSGTALSDFRSKKLSYKHKDYAYSLIEQMAVFLSFILALTVQ